MLFELCDYLVGRFGRSEPCSPVSAGVQDIPSRSFHVAPSCPGIVIPKSVDNCVPDGSVMFYEKPLRESDPDGNNYQVAAFEVLEVQVSRLSDGPCVVSQTCIQRPPAFREFRSPFSFTSGDGAAHVNRYIRPAN